MTGELQPSARGAAAAVDADNPWPGLLAFRERDQEFFQGRRTESADLFRLVMRERVVVFFGLSGLGKSSLLQAGLFPLLRRERVLPVYIRLDFSPEKPDLAAQVKMAIAHEAAEAEIEAPGLDPAGTLWEYFHRRDADYWDRRNRPVSPLLVFDQFEEIFTIGRFSPERAAVAEAFFAQLADLSEGRPPAELKARLDEHPEGAKAFSFGHHDYKILLSIREDFLAELEDLRVQMPLLGLNRLRLGRMNGEAALSVVSQASHLVDADVAEQIVRFVAAAKPGTPLAHLEVEPALLSVVCRELNNRRRSRQESKITASLLQGSQQQVLTELYENSVADLPKEVRRFVEDRLITVSGYRNSEAMENALSTPEVTRDAIALLVQRRIIRRDDRGVERLELSHDLLTGVVRASRDQRRRTEAAEQERRALEDAQERERLQRDRRDLKRTRIAATVFLVLTLTAIGLALWAVHSMHEAQVAREAADVARRAADDARRAAEGARQTAESTVAALGRTPLIRQAALAGDRATLNRLLSELDTNTTIRFAAKATDLKYTNPSKQEVYNFELYPDPSSLPTGDSAVAFITYLAEHPTFRNTLMTAGPDRQFRVSYIGWGCLTHITALVEYTNPGKSPSVAEFNMCERLGWQ
jgi:hypothetical protein